MSEEACKKAVKDHKRNWDRTSLWRSGDVRHRCGHDHNHSFFGTLAAFEKKKVWLAERVCPLCYYGFDRLNSGTNVAERAIEMLARFDLTLPTLVGSAKRVAWAEVIRAELVVQTIDAVGDENVRDATLLFAAITDSKAYIEGRHHGWPNWVFFSFALSQWPRVADVLKDSGSELHVDWQTIIDALSVRPIRPESPNTQQGGSP